MSAKWQIPEGASSLHRKVAESLRELYPNHTILHEYPIKSGFKTLYIDIMIPNFIAIECHGIQHEKYSSQFHESKLDLWRQKLNDEKKYLWCEDNNLPLIEIWYSEENKITPAYLLDKIDKALEN